MIGAKPALITSVVVVHDMKYFGSINIRQVGLVGGYRPCLLRVIGPANQKKLESLTSPAKIEWRVAFTTAQLYHTKILLAKGLNGTAPVCRRPAQQAFF